ncbi:MAG: double-strand break repair helicase AddA [Parvularculaceae bacterium]|nr:double-strand break repair helicase AddA [Caulobacterales bacterium]
MSAERQAALEETTRAQRNAADPVNSAFVAANAGSGKTRVLTDRVARLLLAGAQPDRIVCITFTKAAAAEMASRLFEMLGEWALADDARLSEALGKLEGKRKRDAENLARARRLFARALETPGGLKIQTIHSFCERILKRFPLEAGAAPDFSVIEESDAQALAKAALLDVATDARENDTRRAFRRLSERFAPDALRDLLIAGVTSRLSLSATLQSAGGWGELINETAQMLGVAKGEDSASIRQSFMAALKRTDIERAYEAIMNGGKQAKERAGLPLADYLSASDDEARWAALVRLFLTSGNPRKDIGDKATDAADPWARPFLKDKQEAFVAARDHANAADNFADTAAYLTVLRALWESYEHKKAARAALDYDDLISKTRALFRTREESAWVLYKLDQGLEHILLDEAQDTSPAQWDVIEGPLAEFFSGEGAREIERTFFAVGDQKQSIYSFQGADASLFQEKRVDLAKRIEASAKFVAEPLTLSFRTTAPVLNFVDALFEEAGAREGLWEDDLKHGVNRAGDAGLVELWPLTPRPEKVEENTWEAPVDSTPPVNPMRMLAEEVAGKIRKWIDDGRMLEAAGRPVRAGDVMILVQSRGALFHEAIKALGRAGVPVAGADRLLLLEDPAVEDMLAYARAVLLDTDDLSLAEVLKSPFFNLTDEDLLELAPNRSGSLWGALASRAGENVRWASAVDAIRRARAVAAKEGAYEFFVHILETGAPSGRSRLYARLGEASRETIDELLRQTLDHEMSAPRSLQSFVVWFEANAGEIKREMDQTSGAARVMTVHGAKGLEAPIVFLLDAHRTPILKAGPLFTLASGNAIHASSTGVCALSAGAEGESPSLKAARERAKKLKYEEYRRLLYVAATRARDELYVCGIEHGNQKNPENKEVTEKTWHSLALDAFARLDDVVTTPCEAWAGDVLRISSSQTAPVKGENVPAIAATQPPPAWLHAPAPKETPPVRLSPSALADEQEAKSEAAAFSPSQPVDRFFRGRTLHRLLELLPSVAPDARSSAADRLLKHLAPEVEETERAAWRDEALKVLADPAFAPVFAAGSRAEVAIAGTLKSARGQAALSGQIDRLAVTANEVFIVDYKTNRPPPKRVEDVAPAYIAQLAAYRALLQEIYPGRKMRAALLWTFEARLTEIPSEMLDHAFARHIG